MNKIRRIAVFCGSSSGTNPIYSEAARALGAAMAQQKIDLVYGGGSVGLMGIIADEMLAHGREVIGIIPKKIYDWEVGHTGISKLEVVADMHERKAKMADLSDAFIAMPGGIGTLEEIIEAFTWLQLGYHHKPCAFLNTNGYYDQLLHFFQTMTKEGFLKEEQYKSLIILDKPNILLDKLLMN